MQLGACKTDAASGEDRPAAQERLSTSITTDGALDDIPMARPESQPIKAGDELTEPPRLTYRGHDCTDDCSGHSAGYRWAERRDITDPDDCRGNSRSFVEGCRSWAEESADDHDVAEDDEGNADEE